MNTIFLDIDGVIATTKQFWLNSTNFRKKHEWAHELKVPYPFDKKCVNVLNEIIEQTDSEIVLSSDWRTHWSLDELDKIFKHNGVSKSPIDKTLVAPISFSNLVKNRCNEILTYVKNKSLENWIVIDDLNVGYYLPEEQKDRFFMTESNEGIKKSGLKNKILKFLTQKS